MAAHRREVLAAVCATLPLSGCTDLDILNEFDPPDVDWRIESEANRVWFVHDGGEPVELGSNSLRVQHEDSYLLPMNALRTRGDTESVPSEPLTEGDGIALTLRTRHTGDLENGDTVRLLWIDTESDRTEVLAEHVAENQPSRDPPEIDWRVEENATHVRFVHDGGDVLRARAPGESNWAHNHVTLHPEEQDHYYREYPGRVREGDVIAIGKRSVASPGESGVVRLRWENRFGTQNATLAEYEVEVPSEEPSEDGE